jgi:hypothetical protein
MLEALVSRAGPASPVAAMQEDAPLPPNQPLPRPPQPAADPRRESSTSPSTNDREISNRDHMSWQQLPLEAQPGAPRLGTQPTRPHAVAPHVIHDSAVAYHEASRYASHAGSHLHDADSTRKTATARRQGGVALSSQVASGSNRVLPTLLPSHETHSGAATASNVSSRPGESGSPSPLGVRPPPRKSLYSQAIHVQGDESFFC